MESTALKTVCVTGASGFVGSYVCRNLLEKGYTVRAIVSGTVSEAKYEFLKTMHADIEGAQPMEIIEADLAAEETPEPIVAAVEGCGAVFHLAKPFIRSPKSAERDILAPIVRMTTNVYTAVSQSDSVQTVVHLSSYTTIPKTDKKFLKKNPQKVWTEEDVNDDATLKTNPYAFAMRQAEEIAFESASGSETPYKLVVLNVGVPLGAIQSTEHCRNGVGFVKLLLSGELCGLPHFSFPVVHAGDIAKVALEAIETASIPSGRYFLSSASLSVREIATQLRTAYERPRFRVSSSPMPNWVVHLGGTNEFRLPWLFAKCLLDRRDRYDSSKTEKTFSATLQSAQRCVVDTAEALIKTGVVVARDGKSRCRCFCRSKTEKSTAVEVGSE